VREATNIKTDGFWEWQCPGCGWLKGKTRAAGRAKACVILFLRKR
jgi:hypothetical protein